MHTLLPKFDKCVSRGRGSFRLRGHEQIQFTNNAKCGQIAAAKLVFFDLNDSAAICYIVDSMPWNKFRVYQMQKVGSPRRNWGTLQNIPLAHIGGTVVASNFRPKRWIRLESVSKLPTLSFYISDQAIYMLHVPAREMTCRLLDGRKLQLETITIANCHSY